MPNKKITKKKAAAKKATAPKKVAALAEEKVMGFRAGSQAARMYTLLSDGKARTVEEIHKVITDTTESHVRNGLLYVLRKRGTETGQFHIAMTKNHKLHLVRGPKPAKAAKSVQARPQTAEVSERREAQHE